MRLLDRYILKSFLLSFAYCFLGIVAIWIILDLGDKLPNLIEAHASVRQTIRFYRIQFPQIVVFCLPITLLLAILHSFSRLSRSNELVSMITAGVSIRRIMIPLLAVGILASLVSLTLNYRLAPESETRRKDLFDEITHGKPKTSDLMAVLFRNREQHRTWYFERLGLDGDESRSVQVLQQNAAGDPLWKLYSRGCKYFPDTHTWSFSEGETLLLRPDGKIQSQRAFGKKLIKDFDETPARIASTDLRAANLGVPALRNYLQMNHDFPRPELAPFVTHLSYRWALPWACLIVVLLGGPLAIVFSRRGVLGSVAAALLLFLAFTLSREILLSFGQGARLSPDVAAWSVTLGFGLLGLLFVVIRSSGRSLNPFRD